MSSENAVVSEVTSAITNNKMFTSMAMSDSAATSSSEIKSPSFDSQSSTSPSAESANTVFHAVKMRNMRDFQRSVSNSTINNLNSVKCIYNIPIVGYEIMEERARFTVYKLRIENKVSGDCWYVFRRYTDFVRLFSKLKNDFPSMKLCLPRKRWFRDNFNSEFLEDRINGLQTFVNSVLEYEKLCECPAVKEFFCLNEPPSYSENMEESRAIFEALEETIFNLRCQLQQKEIDVETLKMTLSEERKKNDELNDFIKTCTNECSHCSKEFSKWKPQSTSTPVKAISNQ